MVRPIRKFTVVPSLPERIERLRDLAYNVRWSWNYETVDLFRRLDHELWESTNHNPVKMLGIIEQRQLEEAAANDGFLAQFDRVYEQFTDYMSAKMSWYTKTHGASDRPVVAYFSAEYGLTECMPIYSGGLGVLSGDHLKAASDLGYPLVGVGLLYQEGYFRQYLNPDGWQKEDYPINDFYNLPLFLERNADGSPKTVDVHYPGRSVRAQIWRVQAGRVAAYMLDTNIPANSPEDRNLSDELYGGDLDMRIRQEILLGIGGLRALNALGIKPAVCHMNEGHSAFLALERIRQHMQEYGMSFAEGREATVAGNVFTTHTPEPAGIDRFPPDLMDRYFSDYYSQLKISRDEVLGLGRENPFDPNEPFSMAVLALRLSAHARLHQHPLQPGGRRRARGGARSRGDGQPPAAARPRAGRGTRVHRGRGARGGGQGRRAERRVLAAPVRRAPRRAGPPALAQRGALYRGRRRAARAPTAAGGGRLDPARHRYDAGPPERFPHRHRAAPRRRHPGPGTGGAEHHRAPAGRPVPGLERRLGRRAARTPGAGGGRHPAGAPRVHGRGGAGRSSSPAPTWRT